MVQGASTENNENVVSHQWNQMEKEFWIWICNTAELQNLQIPI